MHIGIVSDTHGVVDKDLLAAFEKAGVELLLHAGDVGHHGGEEGVLEAFEGIARTLAVAGNVDEAAAAQGILPKHRLLSLQGWTLLLTHIVGLPPAQEARSLIEAEQPDIVVFGHSHVFLDATWQSVRFINPGSAGPARFRLARSAAILKLPPKDTGEKPILEQLLLAPRGPPRLSSLKKARTRPTLAAGPTPKRRAPTQNHNPASSRETRSGSGRGASKKLA